MSKSEGLYIDAHPTAPGGMSQKALVAEMVNRHGWDESTAKKMKWPDQIDAVIEGRREAEKRARKEMIAAVGYGGGAEGLADLPDLPDPMPAPLFIGDIGTRDYVFDGHAGAGPSASERWLTCTASLDAARRFLETLTPNQQADFAVANIAARQGTTAHAAAEAEANLLLGRTSFEEVRATLMELAIEPDTSGEAYDDEMAEYITEYTDLVKSYADERGPENILIEERVAAAVPLDDENVHEIKGSVDCGVLPTKKHPTLVGIDLKYGEGVDVEVDENSQVRIYVLGLLSRLIDEEGNLTVDIEEIIYHIVQPRLGGIKTWSESLEDLLDWRDEVLAPALALALAGPEGGAMFAPSEKACQWCPARGACPALVSSRFNEASELFDVVTEAEFADGPGAFPETGLLTDERLGSLLSQVQGLIKIHDDLKDEAQRRLFRGGKVPGYQLVNYSPARQWGDEAETYLKDEADLWTEPKLMSPTQALATAKQKHGKDSPLLDAINEHVITPAKRPVIAREGDRRKTWTGVPPEQMFPDETGGI